MTELYRKNVSEKELHALCGDLSQVGGLRPVILNDGPGRGLAAVDVETGSGLTFNVLLDRGMDISRATWQGRSLCWRSAVGERVPGMFEYEGLGWLRSFFGGLLTTCGPTFVGAPCQDEGERLGLHGRWTTLAASQVACQEQWSGDQYEMSVRGCLREARVFGPDVHITRRISTRLGSASLSIQDTILNADEKPVPLMMLYHCNIGWPVLAPDARLVVQAPVPTPRDDSAKAGLQDCLRFQPPATGYREQCFGYHPVADGEGLARAAIINDSLDGGLGVYLLWPTENLPCFTQWKMMGRGNYVCGLEPANCFTGGRAEERQAGRLRFLQPGQQVVFHLEIGVLVGPEEINQFCRHAAVT